MTSDQYIRRLSLVVANATEALDLSALRVSFTVRQWSLQTPGNLTARIYNVSDRTAQSVQKEFTRVVLQAGYENGAFGVVFDGTIVQIRRGRENATDTYLDIIAADGDLAYNYAIANYSMAAGDTTPDNRIAQAVRAMNDKGVTAGSMPDSLPTNTLPRGKVVHSMARDVLRTETATISSSWSIAEGKVNIVQDGSHLPGDAIVLSSATGMIGLPQQTVEGISVRALLNPKIKANCVVQINRTSIQTATLDLSIAGSANNAFLPQVTDEGFYRVLLATFTGDTRGQDWYVDAVCVALGQPATQALVEKGYA